MPSELGEWFWGWFQFHKLMAPHQAWAYPQYSPRSPIGCQMFDAWMEKFARLEVAEAEAREASLRLNASQPGFPEHHLAAIVEEVGAIREEAHRRRQAESFRAFRDSADALHARRQGARERWAAMGAEEQDSIRARVARENPGLRRFPKLIETLCLDEIEEQAPSKKAKV